MVQDKNNIGFWQLIRYIFDFLMGRKRAQSKKDYKKKKKVIDEVKKDYEDIDNKKNKRRDKDIDDRLKDLF